MFQGLLVFVFYVLLREDLCNFWIQIIKGGRSTNRNLNTSTTSGENYRQFGSLYLKCVSSGTRFLPQLCSILMIMLYLYVGKLPNYYCSVASFNLNRFWKTAFILWRELTIYSKTPNYRPRFTGSLNLPGLNSIPLKKLCV